MQHIRRESFYSIHVGIHISMINIFQKRSYSVSEIIIFVRMISASN